MRFLTGPSSCAGADSQLDEAREQERSAKQNAAENEQSRHVDEAEVKRLAEEKKRKIEEQRQQSRAQNQTQAQAGPSGRP